MGNRQIGSAMRAVVCYVAANPGALFHDVAQSIYPRKIERGHYALVERMTGSAADGWGIYWFRQRPEYRPIFRALERGLIIEGPTLLLCRKKTGLYLKRDEDRMRVEAERQARADEEYPEDAKARKRMLRVAISIGRFLQNGTFWNPPNCMRCIGMPMMPGIACWFCGRCGASVPTGPLR